MKKQTIALITVIILALASLKYDKEIEHFWFRAWHNLSSKTVEIGNLTLTIPEDWIVIQKEKKITISKAPEARDVVLATYGKITQESAESRTFTDPDGTSKNYKNFEPFELLNYRGFLASVVSEHGLTNTLISFPDDKLYFSYYGSLESYEEFLKMLQNAKPRKW